MWRWGEPDSLRWLILIPVVILFSLRSLKRSGEKVKKLFGGRLASFLTSSVSQTKRKWKIFLQGVCLLFMLLALAQPQIGQSSQVVRSEGVELIVLADVSSSMLAEDLHPTRLDLAKIDMGKLVENLGGSKIGLVAFAGSPVLLSPLTTDPGALKLFIDSLSPSSVSTQGTSFRLALREAKSGFDRASTGEEDVAVTKVIVIMSDGEDHEPGALESAKKLIADGVHIFAIAYGTEKGAPIPERDSLGYIKSYKKDRQGNTVITTVNGKALEALAFAGGGSFYFASPGGNYLTRLVESINKLEKTQIETKTQIRYSERFQLFLGLSFLFGLIELLLGDRRRSAGAWRGRFEAPLS